MRRAVDSSPTYSPVHESGFRPPAGSRRGPVPVVLIVRRYYRAFLIRDGVAAEEE